MCVEVIVCNISVGLRHNVEAMLVSRLAAVATHAQLHIRNFVSR